MPTRRTKLIISHLAVAILSSILTWFVIYYPVLRGPTPEQKRYIANFIDETRCFGNARDGYMSASELSLFEKLKEQCAKGNVEELNRLLDVKLNSLSINCGNDGQQFKEPIKPVIKFIVKNVSDIPVPILEPELKKIGWSTKANNGEWLIEYSISEKNLPSWVKVLDPGQEIKFETVLEPQGYGGQKINYVYSSPVWKSITKKSLSKTTNEVYRGACTYGWESK